MTIRKRLVATLVVGALAVLALGRPALAQVRRTSQEQQQRSRVEVVFCLDTTGSMGGLIDSAKQKVWSICNQIAGGQPRPLVKVGLVAYRDRGDEYITKTFDLSDDLDAVHSHLNGFQAAGGGDEPESVNEALHVALNNIQWSRDPNVLRIIYLVGDAPPHMDYPNDITYKVTCKKAAERGIIINTVQCGNAHTTTTFWKEIAQNSQGRFVQIAQDGGVITVSTPYDQRLAEINAQLCQTGVVYGDRHTQAVGNGYIAQNKAVVCAPAMAPASSPGVAVVDGYTIGAPPMATSAITAAVTAAADRAGFNAKNCQVGAWDLIDSIKSGNVKLESLKTEELPEQMQKMDLAERKAHLAKVESERSKLQAEALDLDRQRGDFLSREMTRNNGQAGFDAQVLDMLREQAKSVNIRY